MPWASAARPVTSGGEESSVDLAAAGGVFETLASALRHAARRGVKTESDAKKKVGASLGGAEADAKADAEADAEAAAAHTLRAAETLAEAMERRREGVRARARSKEPREKSGSLPEPGTDALERLVAAAAARLGAMTEELEGKKA